jgi:hypothetical protein
MIYESHYWKKELIKLSKKLTIRLSHRNFWTESQHGTFEKEVMIGFYIIRKLIEAQKLSNAIVSTKMKVIKYQNNGKIVHLMNTHKFDKCFDFLNPKQDKYDLIFLSNQIIHSYIFTPVFNFGGFKLLSIQFCSDKDRNKWLYEIDIKLMISIFEKVGNNYPASSSMHFDESKKDYKVFQKDKPDKMASVAEINEVIKQLKKTKR